MTTEDNGILYRTNSYSDNNNPCCDIIETLLHTSDLQVMLRQLNSLVPIGIGDLTLRIIVDGVSTDQQYYEEFVARPEAYKREIFSSLLDCFETRPAVCCWFTRKDIVLNRKTGYGRYLCSDNGVLRCFEPGTVLLQRGFDTLRMYPEPPKLMPDSVINKQLISKQQLNKLLELEETYGKILTETCLKKDVLNLLKRADKGLLGNSFNPSTETRERYQELNREQILNDLL